MRGLPEPGQLADAGLHVRMFGSHAFFRLWLAQVVDATGDWLGFLAIVIVAARVGAGSPGASVGVVMAVRIIPGFFFAAGAGVLIDRMDRKRVMLLCNVVRAGVVLTLPFVDTVLGLVVASFVLEIATLFFTPAKEASVPHLVPTEYLTTANSLSLAAAYGTFPIASALFAVLAKVAEQLGRIDALSALRTNQTSIAFYVDALTYVISALVIARLAIPKDNIRPRDPLRTKRFDLTGVFSELKEGWQFIFINPIVRTVNIGLATGLIGGGMLVPLGPEFSAKVLGAGAAGFGVFVTALGFGVAVGVVLVSLLQRRLPKPECFAGSAVVAGISLLIGASMSSLALAALFVFVLGMCAGSVYVLGFTLLHENVEDALRGRIFSALYTLVRLCILIAFAVGPFLSELLDNLSNRFLHGEVHAGIDIAVPGVRLTLWLAGLIMLVAGLLATMSLRAGVRARDAAVE
jgi:dTMP kinase